jgi:hypothetical protein
MAPGEISLPYDSASPYIVTFDKAHPGWQWFIQNGPKIAAGRFTELHDAMAVQDAALAEYARNPGAFRKSLYVLNATTGREDFVVPHWDYQTMNGAPTPPCVDREGKLVVPIPVMFSGWGRLDLNRQRVVDLLYDNTKWGGGPYTTPGELASGMGARDENLNVTCTANLIIGMHMHEANVNYTGAFDMDARKWMMIGTGYRSGQMSNNTQGGGGNPPSIAGDMVYHISTHELVARSTR